MNEKKIKELEIIYVLDHVETFNESSRKGLKKLLQTDQEYLKKWLEALKFYHPEMQDTLYFDRPDATVEIEIDGKSCIIEIDEFEVEEFTDWEVSFDGPYERSTGSYGVIIYSIKSSCEDPFLKWYGENYYSYVGDISCDLEPEF